MTLQELLAANGFGGNGDPAMPAPSPDPMDRGGQNAISSIGQGIKRAALTALPALAPTLPPANGAPPVLPGQSPVAAPPAPAVTQTPIQSAMAAATPTGGPAGTPLASAPPSPNPGSVGGAPLAGLTPPASMPPTTTAVQPAYTAPAAPGPANNYGGYPTGTASNNGLINNMVNLLNGSSFGAGANASNATGLIPQAVNGIGGMIGNAIIPGNWGSG